MKTSEVGIWLAIVMLGAVVVLLRSLYLYAPRQWQPRGAFANALRFAPLAALVAIVAPEVLAPWLVAAGGAAGSSAPAAAASVVSDAASRWFAPLMVLLDARVLSAVALLVAARLSGNLLVALSVGALVLWLL